mmetsp:Transcript_29756/g.88286  ORF Transcript_29756/g.88286 Transcript_29756/m.88286 type:complete len:429 (-) Transcript_29756:546-1832(-)
MPILRRGTDSRAFTAESASTRPGTFGISTDTCAIAPRRITTATTWDCSPAGTASIAPRRCASRTIFRRGSDSARTKGRARPERPTPTSCANVPTDGRARTANSPRPTPEPTSTPRINPPPSTPSPSRSTTRTARAPSTARRRRPAEEEEEEEEDNAPRGRRPSQSFCPITCTRSVANPTIAPSTVRIVRTVGPDSTAPSCTTSAGRRRNLTTTTTTTTTITTTAKGGLRLREDSRAFTADSASIIPTTTRIWMRGSATATTSAARTRQRCTPRDGCANTRRRPCVGRGTATTRRWSDSASGGVDASMGPSTRGKCAAVPDTCRALTAKIRLPSKTATTALPLRRRRPHHRRATATTTKTMITTARRRRRTTMSESPTPTAIARASTEESVARGRPTTVSSPNPIPIRGESYPSSNAPTTSTPNIANVP